jgi:hydrogenase maturation protein HypF
MHTYHIHINGLVQGVGFRPFVCRIAKEFDVNGCVSNSNSGVHIEFNATSVIAELFYNKIINHPPANAIISHHHLQEISQKVFTNFFIKHSSSQDKPTLLLTPDIALCKDCRQEILTSNNKRYQYSFTTCLQCGPRYSIINKWPYDRENTTMRHLQMCDACAIEYNDIEDRRHYSQTNSCKDCAVPMHLYDSSSHCVSNDADEILNIVIAQLIKGNTVAVKGIGGYLLLCDATSESAISNLRTRKHRSAKPFAILYADIEMVGKDVHLRSIETDALKGKAAPIVLCQIKKEPLNGICSEAIAPGLDKIGLMLAYTPLLLLIATAFGKPLIATSGNISGAPILYKDKEALQHLFEVSDLILTYERDIVTPQDDSVLQFTSSGQRIILRRSRGLAPNYFPNPFQEMEGTILAMGAELKSAFALADQKNLYISQFLGDQGTLESQNCFKDTLLHFNKLLKTDIHQIIIDTHPNYFVSQFGKQLSIDQNKSLLAIQHHKAHFGAVLAENNLLDIKKRVLGFIWDGTGFGEDGQIWGGEIFMYEQHKMNRIAHLQYFSHLLADKMSKEPRLSALSLLKDLPQQQHIIQHYFSKTEWQYYQQLLQQPTEILSSSMGRFLDGIAAILGIRAFNNYEGEAAMQLEALARKCTEATNEYYTFSLLNDRLNWKPFLEELLADVQINADKPLIAWKVFYSLAKMVQQVSQHFKVDQLAFSGGVFQNALLIDLLVELLSSSKELYFHQQLSPNDECIGFGQIACFSILDSNQIIENSASDSITLQPIQFTH